MKIIAVTHSSRPFFDDRCSIEALNSRFENRPNPSDKPFESLGSYKNAVGFHGGVSLWRLSEDPATPLIFLDSLEPDFKIQSAMFIGGRLVVLASDRITLYKPGFVLDRHIFHKRIYGGHMLADAGNDCIWMTNAPSDSVYLFNLLTGQIDAVLPVYPEEQGKQVPGVTIPEGADFARYFVPTDLQRGHINHIDIHPDTGEKLVTFWVQGMVASLQADGKLAEIVRGFRGSHGGRFMPGDDSQIYFTDSAGGHTWFVDKASGALKRRIGFESRWLHDSLVLDNGQLLGLVADRNALELRDIKDGQLRHSVNMSRFGETVMFATESICSDEWAAFFTNSSTIDTVGSIAPAMLPGIIEGRPGSVFQTTTNLVSDIGFRPFTEAVDKTWAWVINRGRRNEYLIISDIFVLPKDEYNLDVKLKLPSGKIGVGVQIRASGQSFDWLFERSLDAIDDQVSCIFNVTDDCEARIVFFRTDTGPALRHVAIDHLVIGSVTGKQPEILSPLMRQADHAPDGDGLTHSRFSPPVPPISDPRWAWSGESGQSFFVGMEKWNILRSSEALTTETILTLGKTSLWEGRWLLSLDAELIAGQVFVGLISQATNIWLDQQPLIPGLRRNEFVMNIHHGDLGGLDGEFEITIAANNEAPTRVEMVCHQATLRYVGPIINDKGQVVGSVPVIINGKTLSTGQPARWQSEQPILNDNIEKLDERILQPGQWELRVGYAIAEGAVALSILDQSSQTWLFQQPLATTLASSTVSLYLEEQKSVELWIVADNGTEACSVSVGIRDLLWRYIGAD